MKKKIFIMLLMLVGAVNAATVFNVDINGELSPGVPDLAPFGEYTDGHPGVFNDGINKWNVFVGGWAVRLVADEVPEGANWQMTKAYVGWLNPENVISTQDSSTTLFLDYASKTGTVTPTFAVIGGQNIDNGTNWSQGVYDLYLYGNGVCDFNVFGTPPQTGSDEPVAVEYAISLAGHNPNDANYFENENYVMIPNLDSSRGISVQIKSGGLAGVQLVDKGILIPQAYPLPGETRVGTDFNPAWASFAYEKNRIGTGPFLNTWSDMFGLYGILAQVVPGEWVTYELYVVGDANAGFYEINCAYNADPGNDGEPGGVIGQVGFQIDDGPTVDVNVNDTGRWDFQNGWTPFQRIYLSKGYHRLKYSLGAAINVFGFRVRKADNQSVTTCLDAQLKGSDLLESDFNGDCITNFKDLATLASQWLNKCAGCP